MVVILTQRILELGLVASHHLGPARLVLAAKYPARHILCFNYKDAKAGQYYVINLRRPIGSWKCEII